MKIRTGFVSNSSSSSFIIVGVELTKDLGDKLEDILTAKYSLEEGGDIYEILDDCPDVPVEITDNFIGISLAHWSDDGRFSLTNNEIQDAFIACNKFFTDLDLPIDAIELHAGTSY